jgi:uncharacterized protein (DUF1684 family)
MTTDVDQELFVAEWARWHHDHEMRRTRPHGFLSITGLHWLSEEPQRFNGVPGAWSCDARDVRVSVDDSERLSVEGVAISDHHTFANVDERGTQAQTGDVIIEICRRDELFMIRPRDPAHITRSEYAGTPTFAPSIAWAIGGTFLPFDVPGSIQVGASVEGLTHVYESRGEIEFALDDTTMRLIAFNDDEPDELFVVFADLTSGTSTYGACRFLTVEAPGADGAVTVDFNRATTPPCAYTTFATCPLPPPENHLPARIEAGEMTPVPGS